MIQFQVRELYRVGGRVPTGEILPVRIIAGLWSREPGASEVPHPLGTFFLTPEEFDALDALTSADWQLMAGRVAQLLHRLREDAHNETGSMSMYAAQLLALLGEGNGNG